MVKAFVLGTVGSRSELVSCLEGVRAVPRVEEAALLWGVYDIIIKVVVEKLEDINDVLDALYRAGVVDTNTLIVNPKGLNIEKSESKFKRKCAYTFIKIRRPAAPKLWEKFLMGIDAVLEAHELLGIYDVMIAVSEDVKNDLFNSYFRKLWLLRDINLQQTFTMIALDL